jgi:threonine dehydratase
MFILAPSLGRSAAHNHIITEIFVYIGVGGLLAGIAMLCANLFFDFFSEV